LAAELGFEVEVSPSDWVLGPGDSALAEALIQGWATAAMEQADQPDQPEASNGYHWRQQMGAELREQSGQSEQAVRPEQADRAGGTSGGYPGRPQARVEWSGQGRRMETRPDAARLVAMIMAWREARLAQNAVGGLRLRVGHQDALLLPGIRPDQ
jgi:hypothetical protein